jgi:hypothetical protein
MAAMSDQESLANAIEGVAYPSFYVEDMEAADAFWSAICGPCTFKEDKLLGWRLGDTWITIFPSEYGPHKDSGPRNTEFAIRVKTPEDVDRLYAKMIELGSTKHSPPADTWMYSRMRFSCLDTPFGIRIDIICPLPPKAGDVEGEIPADEKASA